MSMMVASPSAEKWRRAVAITHEYMEISGIRPDRGDQAPVMSSCCIRRAARQSGLLIRDGEEDGRPEAEWIVDLIDTATPPPKKPGPKPGTKYKPRKKRW